MHRAAVAGATSDALSARPAPPPDSELERRLSSLGRQIGHGRRRRPGRAHLLLIVLLVIGLWLVLVFGRALSEVNEATARQATVAAEAHALEVRLEAARREQLLVQTDSFQALQARALGLGEAGERVFSLDDTALSATSVTPLGAPPVQEVPTAPLDAWLALLFGD